MEKGIDVLMVAGLLILAALRRTGFFTLFTTLFALFGDIPARLQLPLPTYLFLLAVVLATASFNFRDFYYLSVVLLPAISDP